MTGATLHIAAPGRAAAPVAGLDRVATPALLVFAEAVEQNVDRAIALIGLDAWRPHVKTVKSRWVMRLLLERGVTRFKCATTLELIELCEAGAPDVLLAYLPVGPLVERVAALAAAYPGTRISVLAEDAALAAVWAGTPVSVFLDLDLGLGRTGIPLAETERIRATVAALADAGVALRGLHAYSGDLHLPDPGARTRALYAAFGQVRALAAELIAIGATLEEVTTAGTPALRASLDYRGFDTLALVHRPGAGTIVFGDRRSLNEAGIEDGFVPAAIVLSRVISRPAPNRIVCDAGHKAVSADAGVPTCEVLGHPGWAPGAPSEEHLPVELGDDVAPAYGALLRLLPTHICPTVNLHDEALVVREGALAAIEPIAARGHERAAPAV